MFNNKKINDLEKKMCEYEKNLSIVNYKLNTLAMLMGFEGYDLSPYGSLKKLVFEETDRLNKNIQPVRNRDFELLLDYLKLKIEKEKVIPNKIVKI